MSTFCNPSTLLAMIVQPLQTVALSRHDAPVNQHPVNSGFPQQRFINRHSLMTVVCPWSCGEASAIVSAQVSCPVLHTFVHPSCPSSRHIPAHCCSYYLLSKSEYVEEPVAVAHTALLRRRLITVTKENKGICKDPLAYVSPFPAA